MHPFANWGAYYHVVWHGPGTATANCRDLVALDAIPEPANDSVVAPNPLRIGDRHELGGSARPGIDELDLRLIVPGR